MESKKEDRRIRRTRRLLKKELAELMSEKDFKDITVKDITERADLNRGTFYLHYTDTYDLLEKLENETLQDFQSMIDAYVPTNQQNSLTPLLEPIVVYIIENASICRSLFENKASNDFIRKFQRMICENGHKMVQESYPSATTQLTNYFFSFITYGLIGVLHQWFDCNMEMDMHEVVLISDRIITAAARELLS